MFFSKKHSVTEEHKLVTKEFLKFLIDYSTDNTKPKDIVCLLDTNLESCLELYRHSLCLALGLESKLAYGELSSVVFDCMSMFKDLQVIHGVSNKSLDYRKGFLEACMHCIVLSRNQARGF